MTQNQTSNNPYRASQKKAQEHPNDFSTPIHYLINQLIALKLNDLRKKKAIINQG
ncbi:hypothetical protein CLERM_686 [Coxiella-like endosymbiont]|nr:hypothetical protein CLERM_686 [Coxiella-like endosymbiont]